MDDEQRAATISVIMQMEYGPPQVNSPRGSSFAQRLGL